MGAIHMSDLNDQRQIEVAKPKAGAIRMFDIPDKGEAKLREIFLQNNRRVNRVLRQGAWKGQRCFVIGGGPSVKDFNLSTLEGEHTIGVNMAFRLFFPEIIVATDARLWGWIENNESSKSDKELFDKCKAVKVWSDLGKAPLPEDIVIAPAVCDGLVSKDLNNGLYWGTSSGFGALNLALLLGAKEIYLIGFDFYGARWHAGYPEPSETGNDYHLQCFREKAEELKAFGSRIINLNPNSKLDMFEFGKLPTDIRKKAKEVVQVKGAEPAFVNFYTSGPADQNKKYKKLAEAMKASAKTVGIEVELEAVKDRGNWDENTKVKPGFIRTKLDAFEGRPVVWVDADALFNQKPDAFFEDDGSDIMAYFHRDEELQSSLMYFANNERVREYLRKVETLCATEPKHAFGEQIFFQKALEMFPDLKVRRLTPEYCWIKGISKDDMKNPIVEQHQASRDLKR